MYDENEVLKLCEDCEFTEMSLVCCSELTLDLEIFETVNFVLVICAGSFLSTGGVMLPAKQVVFLIKKDGKGELNTSFSIQFCKKTILF